MEDYKMIRILLSLFIILQIPIFGYAGDDELNNSLIIEAKAENVEMVQYYVDQGANVNEKAPDGLLRQSLAGHGCTALYLAAREGHGEVVTILLEAGADINFGEPFFGETALGVSTRKGHDEVVQILKKHGAKEIAVRP